MDKYMTEYDLLADWTMQCKVSKVTCVDFSLTFIFHFFTKFSYLVMFSWRRVEATMGSESVTKIAMPSAKIAVVIQRLVNQMWRQGKGLVPRCYSFFYSFWAWIFSTRRTWNCPFLRYNCCMVKYSYENIVSEYYTLANACLIP